MEGNSRSQGHVQFLGPNVSIVEGLKMLSLRFCSVCSASMVRTHTQAW